MAVRAREVVRVNSLSLYQADELSRSQGAYSQTVLETLERAHLFLVPLDDERRWYRYHHLFGEMLRERLRSGATAAEVARLHQRASAWFAQHEFVEEAIQHALAAGDPEHAAQASEREAKRLCHELAALLHVPA